MKNIHNSFRLLIHLFFLSATAIPVFVKAQYNSRDLYERQFFIEGDDTLFCRILSPLHFTTGKKYPLIVVLHGSGERGNDNDAQLTWGSDLFLDSANREKFPAIVVFPQCPADSSWSVRVRSKNTDSAGITFPMDVPPTKPLQMVMNFIDTLAKAGTVDPKRIYIGGLSMGGFGTFEILWRKPGLFAAAFPICGGGNPASAKIYGRSFPIWVFHGADDDIVPVDNSRIMVNALKAAKAKIKYMEYPGVKHDSWKNAFAEPDLLPWMFAQKR
ncbi:MAG: prolyl oligopeptidase family serine peptidase [Chitinophagaceae bacterium]|nr:prolyl oligopeptidase family serine peptidase [Chitinophagaceae bacterium]